MNRADELDLDRTHALMMAALDGGVHGRRATRAGHPAGKPTRAGSGVGSSATREGGHDDDGCGTSARGNIGSLSRLQ